MIWPGIVVFGLVRYGLIRMGIDGPGSARFGSVWILASD